MSLTPGTKLAHYEILEPIGKGGMGEVYRAKDSKLGRDVAIKVLPDEFAENEERMARFEREARVLASLNHPNIAAVYGLEEDDGRHFLVMELVPGESLAAKIRKGPLSIGDALAIARQLVDALEAAHEHGVVHRDLKPANIQLTLDGIVKVLDFGLAKVETGEAPFTDTSLSPTMTRDATRVGIILGTAPYMSPEQARGLPVDKRSDIFSFGCVLFEMLTGQKAFQGELVSDVMASVIKVEPNWPILSQTARRLRRLLERCLEKDVKQRLRDIGDARLELDEAARAPLDTDDDVDMGRRHTPLFTAMSCLGVAIVTGLLVWRWAPSADVRNDVARFQIEVAGAAELALSPDGRTLAYTPEFGIHLHSFDSWEGRELQGVETRRARAPFFSPDGKWIGFTVQGEGLLYKIPIEGGAPVRVTDIPGAWSGSTWTENGTILLGGRGGIWEVDESGGRRRLFFALPEGEIARSPAILPGGATVLFERDAAAGQSVAIGDLRSGEVSTLVPNAEAPRYLSTGHVIYVVGATLMAAPFEASALTLSGESVAVIDGIAVQRNRFRSQGGVAVRVAVSPSGALVYFSERFSAGVYQSLVLVDPAQTGDNGRTTVDEVRVSNDLRLSPDETRFASQFPGDENDIWIYDFERATTSRLTFDPGSDETPVWSSDGRYIAFAGQRERRTIFRARADGSEDPEPLWESEYHAHVSDWSPDGRRIVLDVNTGGQWEIWLLEVDVESEARPLIESRFRQHSARVSPDGSYLAYVSDESGRQEVYVQRFPDLGDKHQVSNDGGEQPVWARDGRKLFYRSPTHMMAVEVSLGPPFAARAPETLLEDTFVGNPGVQHTFYDVMADGRLLVLEDADAPERFYVNVVLNWFEELTRLVPTDN